MTNAILGALANGAIVSALLAAAVWAGLRLAPRGTLGAAARYAVWWSALVAVFLLPLGYLQVHPPVQADSAGHRASLARPTAAASLPTTAPADLRRAPDPLPGFRLPFPLVLTVGAWSRWVLAAWAVVTGLMLLRLLTSCLLLERRKSEAVPAPEELQKRIDESLAGRGVGRRAAVLRSANIGTPVLAGLGRPAILIPEPFFTELTAEQLVQIGLHEAAHLARWDDYALLAARAFEALLPFHPVVHWIARQIHFERELACDDFVLESAADARSYAACLLRVVELSGGAGGSWAAAGMAGNRSQFARRVDRLLDRNRGPETGPGRGRLLAAIGMVAVLAGVMGRTPRAIALAAPQPAQIAAPRTPAIPVAQATVAPQRPASPEPAPAAAAPQTPAPVVLPVTVQDSENRYVAGLTKQNFRVFEDGVEQRIAMVSAENSPLSVEIIVDQSGSMRDKQALVDAAITQFVQSANPADEFVLFPFNDAVDMAGIFPNDPALILNRLHQDRPRGGTSLRDAILKADEWNSARYPDRMMVVISDGADNSSSISPGSLRDAASAASAPLWAITLASLDTRPRRETPWLRDLAGQSGGYEFFGGDAGQAAAIATGIANQVQYVLRYDSSNRALDGSYRRVRVEVVTEPPGSYQVHARLGYYPNAH